MSDSIFEHVGIRQVYELVTGRMPDGRSNCDAAIVRCPSATHDDTHPSCGLNARKNVFFCHGCGANGGIAAMVIAAGKACEAAEAALWLERELGVSRTPEQRRDLLREERRPKVRPSAAELSGALALEAKLFRERAGVDGLLHASEINAIRATVAQRYSVELAPVPRCSWEGGCGGRDRDPAWPAIFDWALTVASIQLLGAPLIFGETLAPPRAIRLLAEDLAARAMRQLERDARCTLREETA